ncbi:MAG: hypothetical protein LBF89_07400 [Bacteroidales bacterium]|jgi:hypothetical protein|nr:hypothetical protein [Bacteroidales bacterium]
MKREIYGMFFNGALLQGSNNKIFTKEMNAESISLNNRKRKYDLFIRQLQPTSDNKILDVGFSNEEWLSGDNYLEKHYPYPHRITALGVCAFDLFQKRYPQVTAVRYDGKIFPFPDNSFEIGWSNAVI